MEQLAIAPAITVLINVIKPFIPNKNLLPIIAILLWACLWLLMEWDLLSNVLEWIITWAWAVWLHQLSKIWSKNAAETLPDNIREDV